MASPESVAKQHLKASVTETQASITQTQAQIEALEKAGRDKAVATAHTIQALQEENAAISARLAAASAQFEALQRSRDQDVQAARSAGAKDFMRRASKVFALGSREAQKRVFEVVMAPAATQDALLEQCVKDKIYMTIGMTIGSRSEAGADDDSDADELPPAPPSAPARVEPSAGALGLGRGGGSGGRGALGRGGVALGRGGGGGRGGGSGRGGALGRGGGSGRGASPAHGGSNENVGGFDFGRVPEAPSSGTKRPRSDDEDDDAADSTRRSAITNALAEQFSCAPWDVFVDQRQSYLQQREFGSVSVAGLRAIDSHIALAESIWVDHGQAMLERVLFIESPEVLARKAALEAVIAHLFIDLQGLRSTKFVPANTHKFLAYPHSGFPLILSPDKSLLERDGTVDDVCIYISDVCHRLWPDIDPLPAGERPVMYRDAIATITAMSDDVFNGFAAGRTTRADVYNMIQEMAAVTSVDMAGPFDENVLRKDGDIPPAQYTRGLRAPTMIKIRTAKLRAARG